LYFLVAGTAISPTVSKLASFCRVIHRRPELKIFGWVISLSANAAEEQPKSASSKEVFNSTCMKKCLSNEKTKSKM
tara:strand:- start:101 stop:328 length:228 start_codon:yes stop_codon:yes gene_type:complete